ncbi:hypothetical protein [Nitrospira sp. Nam80]
MEKAHGTVWRRRIPGQLLTQIREAQKDENRPHYNYVCLGPLYYLSLGELIEIIKQRVGTEVVNTFGGEWIIKDIEGILGIRNAVCHSRPIPKNGLPALETLRLKMETALEANGLNHLFNNLDTGMFPEMAPRVLATWLETARETASKLEAPISPSEEYETATKQYWWGVETLAGFDCRKVETAAMMIMKYNSLRSGVGSAAIRQRFIENNNVILLLDEAVIELKRGYL